LGGAAFPAVLGFAGVALRDLRAINVSQMLVA
jgi:hypothetical protein